MQSHHSLNINGSKWFCLFKVKDDCKERLTRISFMAYFDKNYFRLFLYSIKVFRYTVDKEVIE